MASLERRRKGKVASNGVRYRAEGAVAQLGERLICIQEVAGSIPTSSTSVAAEAASGLQSEYGQGAGGKPQGRACSSDG